MTLDPDRDTRHHKVPSQPCDMEDGCGAAAGEPCLPGCPSLAYDQDDPTYLDYLASMAD